MNQQEEYEAFARLASEGTEKLDPKEKIIVLRHRFDRAAEAFSKRPGTDEWSVLYRAMCAYQSSTNPK